MEKVLEKVVSVVQQHPDGIPLKKVAIVYSQTYHKNLTLSSLGFDSITSLVSSLHKDLVLDGELVFHKDHRRKRKAKTKAKAALATATSKKMTEESKRVEEALEDILTVIKEHPRGIPLNKISIAYSQKYKHNLTLAPMGFKSMANLVESLEGEVVLRGDMVFPQTHKPLNPQPQSQLAAVKTPKPSAHSRPETPPTLPASLSGLSFLGPSLVSSSPVLPSQSPLVNPQPKAARPAEKLNQIPLYDKVMQVSIWSHR